MKNNSGSLLYKFNVCAIKQSLMTERVLPITEHFALKMLWVWGGP